MGYSVDASLIEYLAKDETKVESFTLTLDDGNGGTVDRTVDVTITGTLDIITTSNSFTKTFSAMGQSMWGEGDNFTIEDHRFIGIDTGFTESFDENVSLDIDPHFHEGEALDLHWHKWWNPIPHVHDPGSLPSLHFHPVDIIGASGSLDFNIKTGLQSDFVLDGGTIDATVPFDIDVETVFDHHTDILTFNLLGFNSPQLAAKIVG